MKCAWLTRDWQFNSPTEAAHVGDVCGNGNGEHAPSKSPQEQLLSSPPQRMMNQLGRRGGALFCWGPTLTRKNMEWTLERCRSTELNPASTLMIFPCSCGMLTQEPMKKSTWPPRQPLYLVSNCLASQATQCKRKGQPCSQKMCPSCSVSATD